MLGTRFVATTESYAHQDYKQALVAAHARDTALTICFQDGWPALHRVLRNRTFVMWERAGCPLPGKRPGEGELVATRSNGEKELRYSALPPDRDFHGAARRWRCMLAWALTMLRICPRPESWFSVFGENAKPRNSVTYEQSNKVLASYWKSSIFCSRIWIAPFPFPLRGKPGRAGSPHVEARSASKQTLAIAMKSTPPTRGLTPPCASPHYRCSRVGSCPRPRAAAAGASHLSLILQRFCDFNIAFRMTSSLRIHATIAIFGAFPAASRCL